MKTIHFPGVHQQRCQAKFAIAADCVDEGMFTRTTILFAADPGCPGKTSPDFGDVPAYLINKVLDQELAGCRLQFIDVFFAGLPDQLGRREVHEWKFKPDITDPSRQVSRTYRSVFDRIKAGLRLPAAVDIEVMVNSPCAGVYPVCVDDHQPKVSEERRLELLNRFNVLGR